MTADPRADPDRRRLTRVIDAIDDILETLEHLHLRDRHEVPAAFTPRLDRLTAALPPDLRFELRTGVPIVTLMESLYAIQGNLMYRRTGRPGDPASRTIPGWIG
jgi:hypothetical protein